VYNAERQRKILEEDGMVEQDRVDFDKYTGKDTCFEHKRLQDDKAGEYEVTKQVTEPSELTGKTK